VGSKKQKQKQKKERKEPPTREKQTRQAITQAGMAIGFMMKAKEHHVGRGWGWEKSRLNSFFRDRFFCRV
jgi:hypothetical protein